jgi:hypothetical protein
MTEVHLEVGSESACVLVPTVGCRGQLPAVIELDSIATLNLAYVLAGMAARGAPIPFAVPKVKMLVPTSALSFIREGK